MKSLTFSKLQSIGINPLTGEACAFSMRILCDLSQEGVELMADYLGIPTAFNANWNRFVGDKPSVASIMIERDAFSKLMVFALFREGYEFVYGSEHGTEFTGYSQEDFLGKPALLDYHQKIRNGEYRDQYPMLRVWVNPKPRTTAPSVGSRNVHMASGRVS